jgi:hypothetical protein
VLVEVGGQQRANIVQITIEPVQGAGSQRQHARLPVPSPAPGAGRGRGRERDSRAGRGYSSMDFKDLKMTKCKGPPAVIKIGSRRISISN